MPSPSQAPEKRKKLLPIVARAFAELGYRRATTAELAQRCGVRENILYRLWPDKKAMFIASIDYVYEQAAGTWREVLNDGDGDTSGAMNLLMHGSEHYGQSGLHRIVFAGLGEADDPEIREALRKMYGRFHRFIRDQIAAHREEGEARELADETISAWAIVGLGSVANIGSELGLLGARARKRLLAEIGRMVLEGRGE